MERKILLFGKTGTGKSHLGNVLLGEKHFDSEQSQTFVTKESKAGKTEFGKYQFTIVDTPGLFDHRFKTVSMIDIKGNLNNKQLFDHLIEQFKAALDLCGGSVDCIIICVDITDRITSLKILLPAILTEIFGASVYDNCVIVFTKCDRIELSKKDQGKTTKDKYHSILDIMKTEIPEFADLLSMCKHRVYPSCKDDIEWVNKEGVREAILTECASLGSCSLKMVNSSIGEIKKKALDVGRNISNLTVVSCIIASKN